MPATSAPPLLSPPHQRTRHKRTATAKAFNGMRKIAPAKRPLSRWATSRDAGQELGLQDRPEAERFDAAIGADEVCRGVVADDEEAPVVEGLHALRIDEPAREHFERAVLVAADGAVVVAGHQDRVALLAHRRHRRDARGLHRELVARELAQLRLARIERERALREVSVATPVVKALLTEQGFAGVSDCLQVYGGHGYIREWGIEQRLRDLRVAMLYEGTNEIQALDLLQRKIAPDRGAALRELLDTLDALPGGVGPARAVTVRLLDTVDALLAAEVPAGLAAPVLLRAVGVVLLARLWAGAEAAASEEDAPFAQRKRATAAVYFQQVVPELEGLLAQLQALAREPGLYGQALACSAGAQAC